MNKLPEFAPIAIFDSGYGGLTIFSELAKLLPEYDFLYLGDNARAPYGTRSFEMIYRYTLEAVKYLFLQNSPLIIIACNTSSAKALRTIQQNDLPLLGNSKRVLGVIRPSVEVLDQYTKNGHIGILATSGTVRSQSYPLEISKLFPRMTVVQQACPMWVPLVENHELDGLGAEYFIKNDIEKLLAKDDEIDTIILGCTHYPLLENTIRRLLPKHITLLNQGAIVAPSLVDYLQRHPEIESRCSKSSKHIFQTTEVATIFNSHAKNFLGEELHASHIEW